MLELMLKRKKPAIEAGLKNAFDTGYANAVSSFRMMTKDKVYFNNFRFGFYRPDSVSFTQHELFTRNETKLLITTDVFGDLTGKSYLLISDHEFDTLTSGVIEGTDAKVDLKLEYVKELDNILSASVITALSNELELKIYGDIPVVAGKIAGNIVDIIQEDFGDHSREVYVTAIYFSFENRPSLNPFFIWVVDSKALKSVETNSTV